MLPSEDGASRVLTDATYLETPENVRLAFRIAGPGARLGAYLLDVAIRTMVLYAIVLAFSIVLMPFASSGLPVGAYFVVAFLLEWGYGCLFETLWNGQTPGKRAFRLRVIKTGGYAIGFYDAMLRNLLRAADFAPAFYAAGFIAAASSPRMQRIGDMVAGTMVVRERRDRLTGALEGLRDFPPLPLESFRFGYRLSERTLETIERLFQRRLELATARVDEIAAILAEPLTKRLVTFEDRKLSRDAPAEFLFRVLRTYRSRADGSFTDEGRGASAGAAPLPDRSVPAPELTLLP